MVPEFFLRAAASDHAAEARAAAMAMGTLAFLIALAAGNRAGSAAGLGRDYKRLDHAQQVVWKPGVVDLPS